MEIEWNVTIGDGRIISNVHTLLWKYNDNGLKLSLWNNLYWQLNAGPNLIDEFSLFVCTASALTFLKCGIAFSGYLGFWTFSRRTFGTINRCFYAKITFLKTKYWERNISKNATKRRPAVRIAKPHLDFFPSFLNLSGNWVFYWHDIVESRKRTKMKYWLNALASYIDFIETYASILKAKFSKTNRKRI